MCCMFNVLNVWHDVCNVLYIIHCVCYIMHILCCTSYMVHILWSRVVPHGEPTLQSAVIETDRLYHHYLIFYWLELIFNQWKFRAQDMTLHEGSSAAQLYLGCNIVDIHNTHQLSPRVNPSCPLGLHNHSANPLLHPSNKMGIDCADKPSEGNPYKLLESSVTSMESSSPAVVHWRFFRCCCCCLLIERPSFSLALQSVWLCYSVL